MSDSKWFRTASGYICLDHISAIDGGSPSTTGKAMLLGGQAISISPKEYEAILKVLLSRTPDVLGPSRPESLA